MTSLPHPRPLTREPARTTSSGFSVAKSAALAAFLAASFGLAHASDRVTLHPETPLQTWNGWGTSLCWWAHIVGGYADPVREDLCKRVFKDLGLTVVRYNIGGGDDPSHRHMEVRAAIPGYLDAEGKWNWEADPEQRWVLNRAIELGAKHLEAFSNSPPYWMTLSGCSSGASKGANNLPIANTKEFAEYLAEVVKHFHAKWHVDFETLEPLNEPSSSWWPSGGRQEGCRIDMGYRQTALVLATRDALAERRLKTRVSASDENSNEQAVSAWRDLSPEAKNAVSQINTHSYSGRAQATLHGLAASAGKPLTVSEYGDGDSSGLTMARQIVKDIREAQPVSWTYWQAIDQGRSGWGFLDMDLNHGKTDYVVNRKYYVFANFSKFLRPGCRFVSIDDASTVAAIKGKQLVLVAVNSGDERPVDFDLSAFRTSPGTVSAFRTSPTENLAPIASSRLVNGILSTTLPAHSVTTFLVPRR